MLENIRLSFKGIVSHKMRSALTMLGIIIGIVAIIVIVSIIEGATQQLKDQFIGNSTNTVTIALYDKEDSYYGPSYQGSVLGIPAISKKNIKMVEDLKGAKMATPVYSKEYSEIAYNEKKSSGSNIYGVEKEFFEVQNLVLNTGRLFTEQDYKNKNNVVVLSSEIAGDLFSNKDAVGKTVIIGNEMFVVVGVVTQVMDYSGINSMNDYYLKIGFSSGNAYVPSAVWDTASGYDQAQSLVIKLDDIDEIVNVARNAADILNADLMSDEFEYRSGSIGEDSDDINTVTGIATVLLVGIASISLLVGGIGVMNIMLVSVTERTREIGLKKALGAKQKVILWQFLTESVVLTSFGGIIGVLLGIGLAYLVSAITLMPVAISVPAILISVGFSMFVGIVFGLVPSIKASKLDPIDALRYE